MNLRFLGQPSYLQFGELLKTQLDRAAAGEFSRIHIVSAFAKMAGVGRLVPHLIAAKAKPCAIFGYVGIDHDGTSREAVNSLNNLCDELFIVHSTRLDVTFHPKLYFFEGAAESVALIGSTNLTSGGLFTNMEAGVFLSKLSPKDEITNELRTFVETLRDVSQPFIRKVDSSNLNQLLALLPTEASLWKSSATHGTSKSIAATSSLFGAGDFPVAPPNLSPSAVPISTAVASPVAGTATPGVTTVVSAVPAVGSIPTNSILGFWKRLSPFDASSSSAPGQIIIPKEFAPLFPPLGNVSTTPSGAMQSETGVIVRFHGLGMIEVIHDARFIKYEPAAHHERPNIEHRFTFHRQNISPDRLEASDILVFEVLENDAEGCWFNVYLVDQNHAQYADTKALSARTFGALYPTALVGLKQQNIRTLDL